MSNRKRRPRTVTKDLTAAEISVGAFPGPKGWTATASIGTFSSSFAKVYEGASMGAVSSKTSNDLVDEDGDDEERAHRSKKGDKPDMVSMECFVICERLFPK